MKRLLTILIVFCFSLNLAAQESYEYPFLDNNAMGTLDLIKSNENYDGRGILIFILDNGVDPDIPGLQQTSHGERKVIDMKDFSNQLNIQLNKAEKTEINGRNVLKTEATTISGYENLELQPVEQDEYYVGVLYEEEYKNSAVDDINQNGRTNDEFAALAFKVSNAYDILKDAPGKVKANPGEDLWVYYIDEDMDGNIDDEKPKFDYKYRFDVFDFHVGDEKTRPMFTFSAWVDPVKMILNVHTTDGSHGSHCAGIAAGNDIYGVAGNDGIAPGAYVASLKIGSNILSGGSTTLESMKAAYEYGAKFMQEAGFEHAVFSMSYGIGSETPGRSEIEIFLNDFVKKNPGCIVVTSNGNSGPGINSTGNPAGAEGLISVGAMVTPKTLKNLYGSPRDKNWVTHFSSRGGEMAKPDIVAPGAASSTVPAFEHGDAFWGTSMACPQVAGACAVLLSVAESEGLKINNYMINRAITYSGEPISGYTQADQGQGLVNIKKALEHLRVLAKRNEYDKVLTYDISTTNTFYPDKQGPDAFWKAGGYVPPKGIKQNVKIDAVFPEHISKEEEEAFYRVFRLRPNVDWLSTDKSEIYVRGSLGQTFGIFYDADRLSEPGLYVGSIYGYTKNEDNGGYPDFHVMVTVVVPHKFSINNDHELYLSNRGLAAGDIDRVFVEVPPAASAMNIELSPARDKWYSMIMYLFGPDGNQEEFGSSSSSENRKEINFEIDNEELKTGTWEILPYCFFQSSQDSYYDLNVKYYGLAAEPEIINDLNIPAGKNPAGKFTVTNLYSDMINASLKGRISGYETIKDESSSGTDLIEKPFSVGSDISKVVFQIEMDAEEFNKFTDLAVNIKDKSGKAVVSSGLSRRSGTVTFNPSDPGDYILEIVPGFTSKETMNKPWHYTIQEQYFYKTPNTLKFNSANLKIYPGIKYDISFDLSKPLPMSPDGFHSFGNIEIRDSKERLVRNQLIRF